MDWLTRWQLRQWPVRSVWAIPVTLAVAGIAAGVLLTNADRDTDALLVEFGAGTARDVLAAIGGGMITFTGFVFSMLLVLVQFGTGRFSPRLVGWFLRSPAPKIALGVFMATFLYALTVLRVVGTDADPDTVPSNAVGVAILLTFASGVVFILLVHRGTYGLQMGSALRRLGRMAAASLDAAYPEAPQAGSAPGGEPAPPPLPAPAQTVRYEGDGGVLQALHVEGLVDLAAAAQATVVVVPPMGGRLVTGAPLFTVHGGREIDERRLRRSVAIGDERLLVQDPLFAFRALVDIATRGPGGEGPTTMVQALDQIERLLLRLANRPLGARVVRDAGGAVRLVQPAPSWEDVVSLALDEVRLARAGAAQVSRRLRALLGDLLDAVPPDRAAPVRARLQALDRAADRAFGTAGPGRERAAAPDRQGFGLTRHPLPGGRP